MRVLELGKFYAPYCGGIETLLRFWCEGLVRLGATVDCVVANDAPRTVHEVINGVRVHRLASYGTVLSVSLCPAYFTSTYRYPADVWHLQFPNPLADITCVWGRAKTPLILSYHSDVVRQAGLMRLYRPLLERLLRRASRIVVATPNHLEYSPWLGPYRRKCEVIPFGIDHSRLKLTVEGQRRVAELRNSAGGLPILLNIGRLVEYKGQRFLIEAAQELRAAVWIVGVGPLDKMLRALACQLGVANRVRFWGAVGDDQLPALLTACDVFVLPSITPNEAFGLVQVEAMACGKPVISCSLRSGVPWVNQAGQTGLIVPPADAKALASACRQLLQDEGLRARLGQTGRQRAEREFDETVMVKRYWQCFERVLGDKCQA